MSQYRYVLTVSYCISSDYLVATMRDRASVNNEAMQSYPYALDADYFSHVLDKVGKHFNILALTVFTGNWLSLFLYSIETKFLWKQHTGISVASYRVTRWWS